MAEYIEREKTISKVRRSRFSGKNLDSREMSFNGGIYEAAIAIEKIPAADVRPERHGRWQDADMNGDFLYKCSECGDLFYPCDDGEIYFKFCPNCGAKMDGKDVTK